MIGCRVVFVATLDNKRGSDGAELEAWADKALHCPLGSLAHLCNCADSSCYAVDILGLCAGIYCCRVRHSCAGISGPVVASASLGRQWLLSIDVVWDSSNNSRKRLPRQPTRVKPLPWEIRLLPVMGISGVAYVLRVSAARC